MIKRFNHIAKVVITLGSLVYIAVQIDKNSALDWSRLGVFTHFHSWILASVLVFPNWLLESAKWTLTMGDRFRFSHLKEVTIGHFAGLSTPFKVGDYWYRSKGKSSGITAVAYANYSLVLALLISGALFSFGQRDVLQLILIGFSGLGTIVYYGLEKLRIPYLTRFRSHIPSPSVRSKLLFLSFLRVFVFSIALTVLLDTAIPSMDFWSIFSAVLVIYAMTAVLPIIQLMDFSVRSSVAIWVFGQIADPLLITLIYFGHSVLHNYIPAAFGAGLWWRMDKVDIATKE
jgi:hypothetical protein